MALNREQLDTARAGRKLATREVHVPEWAVDGDDVVVVQEMTAADRDSYNASLFRAQPGPNGSTLQVQDLNNATAKLVSRCLIDADGNLMYAKPQDVAILGKESAVALDRVADVCRELNGMGPDEEAKAEGESEADPSGEISST